MSGVLRVSRAGDEAGLYNVWKTAFGDTQEYIDGFFTHIYFPGMAAVYEHDGEIISAAYAVPLGKLMLPEKTPIDCAVTYAFGTLPEYRSRGIGSKVAKMTADMCKSTGAAVLCPAEPSLFGYYEKLGYKTFFSAVKTIFLAEPNKFGALKIESARSYSALREELLSDIAHIAYSGQVIAYQEYLCQKNGGGLFSINLGGTTCAASAEILPDGTLFLEELLCPSELAVSVASLIAGKMGAERISVHTPVTDNTGIPYAMLFDGGCTLNGWFGFAFG